MNLLLKFIKNKEYLTGSKSDSSEAGNDEEDESQGIHFATNL